MIVLGQRRERLRGARPGQPAARPASASPFVVRGMTFYVSASIGLAFASGDDPGRDGRGPGPRRRHRDVPGQGRRAGRGRGLRRVDARRAWPSASSSSATCATPSSGHQLHLVYQPIVDLPRAAVAGMEALVRWAHPTHGVISPAKFIPLAEESGLISAIGDWVLEEAVSQLAAWRRQIAGDGIALHVRQPLGRAAARRRDRGSASPTCSP